MITLTNNQQVQIKGKLSYLQDARVFSLLGYYQAEGIAMPANWEDAVKREKQLGGSEYSFTLMSACLSNNPVFYEEESAARALAPILATGDIVELEGKTFKITNTGNNNFGLEQVEVRDADVDEYEEADIAPDHWGIDN